MEIKWVKLYVNMFTTKKIRRIRRMPDGDKIVLIWVMLLAQAGICNAGGFIYFLENIPYSVSELADELEFTVDTVKLALQVFKNFGMIEIDENGFLMISNWEEYQNVDSMDKIREQTKKRVEKYRDTKKNLLPNNIDCNAAEKQSGSEINEHVTQSNVTCNVTVTQSNADVTQQNKRENKSKEVEYTPPPMVPPQIEGEGGQNFSPKIPDPFLEIPCDELKDLFNKTCAKLTPVSGLSHYRRKKVVERWREHPDIDYWRRVFELANNVSVSSSGWSPSFDWLIDNDNNYIKVLEGQYDRGGGCLTGLNRNNINFD